MLTLVNGNLLDAKETYLCHQCNCVSFRSAHLAKDVFNRFPYANVYREHINGCEDEPGTILIRGNGEDKRFVVAMFGQLLPGKSRRPYDKDYEDCDDLRLLFFQDCLNALQDLEIPGTFAMPYGIGCGAAGGDWKEYYKLIEEFAQYKDVTLYKI